MKGDWLPCVSAGLRRCHGMRWRAYPLPAVRLERYRQRLQRPLKRREEGGHREQLNSYKVVLCDSDRVRGYLTEGGVVKPDLYPMWRATSSRGGHSLASP
jgi:hypothetical protein